MFADTFPTQTVIEGHVGADFERVLSEDSEVPGPRVQELEARLLKVRRRAQQEIGKIVACLAPVKLEQPVARGEVARVDLVVAELAAELHGVAALDLGEAVGEMPRVVELPCHTVRHAQRDAERLEGENRETFVGGGDRDEPQAALDEPK